jgi:hypothetical protein
MMRSRLILLCLAGLLAVGLWVPPAPPPNPKTVPGGDIVLFSALAERLSTGAPYYETMREELRQRGYPTASIFNWRPPATVILMAKAPSVVHVVMCGLGILAFMGTVWLMRGRSVTVQLGAAVVALGSAVLPFLPISGLYLPELWAGIFLLLSVLAYSIGAVRLAAGAAVLAVFAREIAMPYVLVSLAIAIKERRMQEIRWYLGGLAMFALYYGVHIVSARQYIRPGDMAHTYSWIAFQGWPFVVSITAVGGWHMLLPRWTAAIGAVLMIASVWSPADRHVKIMAVTYAALFCVVGQAFNNSWGLLTGPSWGLATAYGILGLQQLVRSASRPTGSPRSSRQPELA